MALKQTRKRFGFMIYSRFKDGVCIAVKRDAKVLTRYIYSQLSLRRIPLGPALSVHLREVSVL